VPRCKNHLLKIIVKHHIRRRDQSEKNDGNKRSLQQLLPMTNEWLDITRSTEYMGMTYKGNFWPSTEGFCKNKGNQY